MKLEDLHKHCEPFEIPPPAYQNLVVTLGRINRVEAAYRTTGGKAFISSSGFRTWKIHKDIYRMKNDLRIIKGLPEIPIPLRSRHLTGQAVDIWDPDGTLAKFVKDNNCRAVIDAELWCEEPACTPDYVHFQTAPPKSGKRFFFPF